MRVQWTPHLAVGNAVIDNQHKEIFAKVDELLHAMSQGRGRKHVADVLGFLERYVIYHFSAEEKIMQTYRFPDVAAHKQAHAEFVSTLLGWKERITATSAPLDLVFELQTTLTTWLTEHIGVMDRALGTPLAQAPPLTPRLGSPPRSTRR